MTVEDVGLAAERTRLAWRRTALGLAAGGVAGGRLLQDVVGPVSWVLGLAGLVGAGLVLLAAGRRRGWLLATRRGERPGGQLVGVCAVGVTLLGVAALAVVVAHGTA
ncbi:DUF202 domain-containing protein [Cellulomonas fimi]|uniref:DUF202 domain-containing protein n=1 Tax=Cellulomonas fimi TaxID=1708 RepID=UPI00234CFA1A|nr:DUF202 domain-containing protein [Cellulomonas fimi]MDC7120972.1 DUF202 domain-containing protein [Cellulomonas fimi]